MLAEIRVQHDMDISLLYLYRLPSKKKSTRNVAGQHIDRILLGPPFFLSSSVPFLLILILPPTRIMAIDGMFLVPCNNKKCRAVMSCDLTLISDRVQFVLLMVYGSFSFYALITHPYYCLITTCSTHLLVQVQCTPTVSSV
jgi:hypothetical protein